MLQKKKKKKEGLHNKQEDQSHQTVYGLAYQGSQQL